MDALRRLIANVPVLRDLFDRGATRHKGSITPRDLYTVLIAVLTGVVEIFDVLKKATTAAGVVVPESILTDGVIGIALLISVVAFTAKKEGAYVDGQLVRHGAKVVALVLVVLGVRQSRIVLDEARPLPADFYGFLTVTGANTPLDQATVQLEGVGGRELPARVETSDEAGLYEVMLPSGTSARRWAHLKASVGRTVCAPPLLSLRRSDQLPAADVRWATVRAQVGRQLGPDEVFVHYVSCPTSP